MAKGCQFTGPLGLFPLVSTGGSTLARAASEFHARLRAPLLASRLFEPARPNADARQREKDKLLHRGKSDKASFEIGDSKSAMDGKILGCIERLFLPFVPRFVEPHLCGLKRSIFWLKINRVDFGTLRRIQFPPEPVF